MLHDLATKSIWQIAQIELFKQYVIFVINYKGSMQAHVLFSVTMFSCVNRLA